MRTRALVVTLVAGCVVGGCSRDRYATCAEFSLVYDPTTETCMCPISTTWTCADGGSCICVDDDGGGRDGGRADAGIEDDATVDASADARDDACELVDRYRDADGDGFGDLADTTRACGPIEGYVSNAMDCDDACPTCRPGGTEACDTPTDEDCDGDPVTGCGCSIGTVAHCAACGDSCGWSCEPGACNDIVSISIGDELTCALREGGSIACWGESGAIGFASDRAAPLPGVSGVAQLDLGLSTWCAVFEDHHVECAGSNTRGQLGDGTTTSRTTPAPVTGITSAVEVSAGGQHVCVRTEDERAFCWGSNVYGQVGVTAGPDPVSSPQMVALTGVRSISAGTTHTCAVLATGAVWCWGQNMDGQLGDGTRTSRSTPVEVIGIVGAVQVVSGSYHSCASRFDGTAACWGDNLYGQLGDGTTTDRTTALAVTAVNDVIELSSGPSATATCALRGAGDVRCWGRNQSGQTGDGTTTSPRSTPTPVSGLSDIVSIAAGSDRGCAVTRAGAGWCWGRNLYGSLGDGTRMMRTTPVAVLPP